MSINIRQHKTHRKIDSQEKTEKQNKTNTSTAVNQSVTPGHHSQWNSYMPKAYSNDFMAAIPLCNIIEVYIIIYLRLYTTIFHNSE